MKLEHGVDTEVRELGQRFSRGTKAEDFHRPGAFVGSAGASFGRSHQRPGYGYGASGDREYC